MQVDISKVLLFDNSFNNKQEKNYFFSFDESGNM